MAQSIHSPFPENPDRQTFWNISIQDLAITFYLLLQDYLVQMMLEMEVPRCLLKLLPEDVLCTLFIHWLKLKDVVRVDTAVCQRDVRERYLVVITKYSLKSFPETESNVDCGLRWLAKKNIPCHLESLTVMNVSDEYEANLEQCATMLTSVTYLKVIGEGDSAESTTRWLELVTPSCRNLQIVDADVTAPDVAWIRLLPVYAPLLSVASLFFGNIGSIPTYPLLQDLAACRNLKTLYLKYGVLTAWELMRW